MDLSVTQMSLVAFGIFAIFVYLIYRILPMKRKWIALLIGSYFVAFLLSSYWIFLLVITTTIVYLCALFISKLNEKFEIKKQDLEKEDRKKLKKKYKVYKMLILWAGVLSNLLIWALLKYCNLPIFKINNVFQDNFFISIAFPILGISYYTLQALGYLIDVYRGKYSADKNYFRLALFLGYFPQLIEGPIGRYDTLANQLYEGHQFNYRDTAHGIQLALWGIFKKVVIADRLNIIVKEVFNNYSQYSGIIVAFTAVLYAFQLYTDFSGYIDIATGISEMFGIHLQENFRQPFASQTVGEFWRRWHISLGGWLRDYIFYPISLSKGMMAINKKMHGKVKLFFEKFIASAIPMFFVWLTCGIWHGSGVQYVVYGMYYYVIMLLGMLLEPVWTKLCEKLKIKTNSKPMIILRVARTFMFVCIGLMLFRANSLQDFGMMFGQLFKSGTIDIIGNNVIDIYDFVMIFLSIGVLITVECYQIKGYRIRESIDKMNTATRWTIYMVLIFAIIMFGAYGFGYFAVDPMYALY